MNSFRFIRSMLVLALSLAGTVWAQRTVSASVAGNQITGAGTAAIVLASQGDENALGFSVTFNAAVLRYDGFTAGTDATGMTINPNVSQATAGKVGFAMALAAGSKFTAGTRQLVVLNFTALTASASSPIAFGDSPILSEISDVTANTLTATYNSATIVVTVPLTAPTFTTQPAAVTVNSGQNATFTAAAGGNPTPTLKWQKSTDAGATWTDLANGGRISGVTTGSLLITGALAADVASYRAVATNTQGTTNSNAATLTIGKVNQTISFGALATVPVGAAPFNLTATASSGLPVSYTSSNTAVATISGSTVTVLAAGTSTITASQAGNADFNAATNATQTLTVAAQRAVSAVVTGNQISGAGTAAIVLSSMGDENALGFSVTFNQAVLRYDSFVAGPDATGATINPNELQKANGKVGFAISLATGSKFTAGSRQLIILNFTVLTPSAAETIGFGDSPILHEISDVTANTLTSVYLPASIVVTLPPAAPAITTQPTPTQTVTSGQNATFTAAANGNPVPTVKWQKSTDAGVTWTDLSNGGRISGATTTTLLITGALTIDAASYRMVATNAVGTVNSAAAVLTVNKIAQTITFGALTPVTFPSTTITLGATASSGLAVTYASSNTAVATVSGNTVTVVGAGSTTITASQVGNSEFSAATPVPQTLTVAQSTQTISFGALTAKTFGDGTFALTATASSGLPVSYVSSNPAVATVSASTVTIVGAGNTTITASQAGNTNVAAATSVDQPLVVAKANQTITFAAIPSKAVDSGTFSLGATSTSGLAVTYATSNNTPASGLPADVVATVAGSTVTLLNKGTITITASHPGNANYNAATAVPQVLTVLAASQAITFAGTELAGKKFGDANITLVATTTATGLTVGFASDNPAVATISGSSLTITGAGTANITASQAGNANFAAATPVVRLLTVAKAPSVVTLGSLAATYDGTPKPATATTNPSVAAGNVIFTYTGTANASTPPINVGSYGVTATIQDPNYTGTATGTLVVGKGTQTITFGTIAAKTFGDAPFTVTATASSGLPVTFTSVTPTVATITPTGTITILTGGSTVIRASQVGDANWNAATDANQTLTVSKQAATVVLTNLSQVYTGAPRVAGATTTPTGLTVDFTYTGTTSSTTAPTNAGGTYTVTGTINDPRYIGSATSPLVITKADQTITFGAIPSKAVDSGTFTLGATTSSGLAVSYATSNNTPASGLPADIVATVAGSTVTLVNKGAITITASQAGDSNYNAATAVPQVLTVLAAGQTITFAGTELAGKTFGDANITLSATTTATGLTVGFASDNPAVATISGTTLTIVGAGTSNITASQAGNANFAAATPVVRVLTVAKKAATVALGNLTATFDGTAKAATATTTPTGLNVTFAYTGTTNATTPPTNAGTYPVVATIQENNYTGTASGNVVISKANQTITFTSAGGTKLINAAPYALTATSTSNLPVGFASSNTAVATVSGSTVTVVGLGSTTITASQAGDTNYNAATGVTQTLVVNAVAPQILSLPPLSQTAVRGSSFVFGPITLNALSASASRIFSTTPAIPAPGLALNTATGVISGTPTTEGNYSIVLTATNETGSDSRTIALVVQPPAPVITSPAAVSVVAGTAISYTVTTNPATGPTLSVTGLPGWLSFNTTTGVFTGTPTVVGNVTVQVTATNATGSAVLPLLISVQPNPAAPVYNGTLTPSGKVGVPFSFTPDFGAGTTTYAITSGTLPTPLVLNTSTGVISGTPAQSGSFAVTLTATRSSLSASANLVISINPADQAPSIVFGTGGNTRSTAANVAINPNITLSASPSTPTATFAATGLPAGVTINATTGVISGAPTTVGTYNLTVSATNSNGKGPDAVAVITVTPNPNAPVVTSAPQVQGRVGVVFNYSLSATSGGTAVVPPALTYGMTGTLPTGLTFDGTAGTISGTPAAGTTGQYTVFFAGTIAATGTGNALSVTITIAPPLTVPVVNSNGSAQGQVGQVFSYSITASNTPTSYGATPLPAGLTLNATTGVISGVPSTATAVNTPAKVTLTASNADGASNPKTLEITIAPAPATPIVTSGGTANGRVGLAFTYQITANNSPTSYVVTGQLPPGLTANPTTGVISGTPTTSGTFTSSLAAAGATGLGATSPLAITIAPAPTAPAITSAATAVGQAGTAFSYQIVASPGTITSYGLTGTLPVGVTFNSSTGLISGSPTSPGPFSVSLTATSDGGTSLPQALSIQINPAANVPVVTSAGSATGNVGAAFTYTIDATNTPTSRDAVNLPSGLAVNPYTGIISGTPTTVAKTVASLVATNASGVGPTRDLTIDIQPSLSAPVITGATQVSAQVGTNFTYQITATGTPTSYEVIGAPAWMTVNSATGAIAGTPTAPTSLALLLRATNSAGTSAPGLFTVNIAAAPNTPLIGSSRTLTGKVGTLFTTYTVTATPAATSFLAIGLPLGLSLNSATGDVTGTPTSSGTYIVKISGTNANGVGASVDVIFDIAASISFGN